MARGKERGATKPTGLAVVLCALPLEYREVRSLMAGAVERELPGGALFEEGTLPESQWRIAVGELGEGIVGAGVLAERAMRFFAPDLVLFVGVAGSLKDDLRVGDVVVATRVDVYAGGKAADDFLARPRTWEAPFRIVQRARAVSRNSWPASDFVNVDGNPPVVQFKPIAAGDVVLSSRQSSLFAHLRLHYNDAVAIEMEGAGLAHAAHLNDDLPAIVIRGISDTSSPDKDQLDSAGWQRRAAAHAASFAAALLLGLNPTGTSPKQPRPFPDGSPTSLASANSENLNGGGPDFGHGRRLDDENASESPMGQLIQLPVRSEPPDLPQASEEMVALADRLRDEIVGIVSRLPVAGVETMAARHMVADLEHQAASLPGADSIVQAHMEWAIVYGSARSGLMACLEEVRLWLSGAHSRRALTTAPRIVREAEMVASYARRMAGHDG